MDRVLIVDWKKCAGCRICELICSLHHDEICNPSLSRIRVIRDEKRLFYYPGSCAGCTKPVCKEVCPVKAISLSSETGAYVVDEEKCIGCKECILHCPFGAPNIHPIKKKAFKCDLCGGEALCALYCPTGAITFDIIDIHSRTVRRNRAEQIYQIDTASPPVSPPGAPPPGGMPGGPPGVPPK